MMRLASRSSEMVEISGQSTTSVLSVLGRLCPRLRQEHLRAVSLGRLMRDAGVSA